MFSSLFSKKHMINQLLRFKNGRFLKFKFQLVDSAQLGITRTSCSAGACQDENECANGRHTCDSASMCTNTIGSYKCACDNGFEDNGNGCVDINECAKQACLPDATCTNLVGSYDCACNDGFKGNGMLCMSKSKFRIQEKVSRFRYRRVRHWCPQLRRF